MVFDGDKTKLQQGIFLIEVLIAAVVVGAGLMSLASFQVGLMASSRETKARTEAIIIAEAKQEALRNNMSKADYDAIESSIVNDLIRGSHTVFSRTWVVSDAINPNRKNINVKVTWGNGDVDETVNLVSELAWEDPGKALYYATGSGGLSGKIQGANNNSSNVDTTQFTLSQITGETDLNDGSHLIKYDDKNGHLYLLDSTGKALVKFKGGISHTIKGQIYKGIIDEGKTPAVSLLPLVDYSVLASDLAYCVFPVTTGKSDYICYFGGDCSNGGDNCSTTTSIPSLYGAVSGGWYGKIGLVETSATGSGSFHNKKVCFAEDIASDTVLESATARLYSAQRLNINDVVVGLEGINQSFSCQDFLVVTATESANDCHYFRGFSGLSLPSSSVQRLLKPNDKNVSLGDMPKCPPKVS